MLLQQENKTMGQLSGLITLGKPKAKLRVEFERTFIRTSHFFIRYVYVLFASFLLD